MMMLKLDCILIPGGGLLDDGSLPPWSLARLDQALSYKALEPRFVLLSGGTVHKAPPIAADGKPIHESRQAAEYLLDAGIHPGKVLTEISSYDTIGNAYFSRLLFTEPLKLQRLLVITSGFHMPRTRSLFEWIYFLPPKAIDYQIEFESSPDTGLDPEALAARVKRETKSLDNLEITKKKITDMYDLANWMYTEHNAYNSQNSPGPISDQELKSY